MAMDWLLRCGRRRWARLRRTARATRTLFAALALVWSGRPDRNTLRVHPHPKGPSDDK
jgi:hypothetical protein